MLMIAFLKLLMLILLHLIKIKAKTSKAYIFQFGNFRKYKITFGLDLPMKRKLLSDADTKDHMWKNLSIFMPNTFPFIQI